ncbi:response regulator transcription factor [bacterium SCSIO 12741]|nr:response regulator transcription factor [bacterium SCSIO 12741]
MTLRERYGLQFVKSYSEEYDLTSYRCVSNGTLPAPHVNFNLCFIDHLSLVEVEDFIQLLDDALSDRPYDDQFITDGTEADKVFLQSPDVIINDTLSLPITDMKELLVEWLAFIKPTSKNF